MTMRALVGFLWLTAGFTLTYHGLYNLGGWSAVAVAGGLIILRVSEVALVAARDDIRTSAQTQHIVTCLGRAGDGYPASRV